MVIDLVQEIATLPLDDLNVIGRLCSDVDLWQWETLQRRGKQFVITDHEYRRLTEKLAFTAERYGLDGLSITEIGDQLGSIECVPSFYTEPLREKLDRAYVVSDHLKLRMAGRTPGVIATVATPLQNTYAEGFRSVNWNGEYYEFTAMQAACVKVLWTAWENGTKTVDQATILEQADSKSRDIRSIFKQHPSWKSMIVSSRKGAYSLSSPNK